MFVAGNVSGISGEAQLRLGVNGNLLVVDIHRERIAETNVRVLLVAMTYIQFTPQATMRPKTAFPYLVETPTSAVVAT